MLDIIDFRYYKYRYNHKNYRYIYVNLYVAVIQNRVLQYINQGVIKR